MIKRSGEWLPTCRIVALAARNRNRWRSLLRHVRLTWNGIPSVASRAGQNLIHVLNSVDEASNRMGLSASGETRQEFPLGTRMLIIVHKTWILSWARWIQSTRGYVFYCRFKSEAPCSVSLTLFYCFFTFGDWGTQVRLVTRQPLLVQYPQLPSYLLCVVISIRVWTNRLC